MKKQIISKSGFTLIELLIYIGIVSFVVIAVTIFTWEVIAGKIKNETIAELNSNISLVNDRIQLSVDNARSVTIPSPKGSSGQTLTLVTSGGSTTTYSLVDGAIFVSENGGANSLLTSSKVLITNLTFINLSRDNSPGIVRLQFDIEYINSSNKQEYDTHETYDNSFSLRPNL